MRLTIFKRYYIFILFSFFSWFSSFSQDLSNRHYNDSKDLLYGIVYIPENYNAVNHEFFLNDKLLDVKLNLYNEKKYTVFVKYDLYNQQLVLFQDVYTDSYRFLSLNPDLIKDFQITYDNELYNFVPANTYSGLSNKIVFYEVIYSSEIKYLVGRSKVLYEFVVDTKNKFGEECYHYIIIDDEAIRINNKRQLYNLFGDYKKQIKSFVRKNRLKINFKDLQDIVQLIEYYEKLNN